MTEPRPVILDCDPGHDDALAIVLALARPIETEGELMHGRTVVDLPGLRRLPANARVGVAIDDRRFITCSPRRWPASMTRRRAFRRRA